jgi:transmembrane sensor
MSNLAFFPDVALAREQAAQWIARSDRGLTAAEQVEFHHWRANPTNARALQELSALWDDLGVLNVLADVFPAPQQTRKRQHGARLAVAAAAILVIAVTSVLVSRIGTRTPAVPVALSARVTSFETAVGEQRSVALADGSVLTLNTDSQVEVVMGSAARELRLLRGEVHFTVAHDASRPFRVNAGGRIVQAVGTAFDVRMHQGQVIEVIVTEGRVKVLAADAKAIAEKLDRGQVLRVEASGSSQVRSLDSETLAARLAWRNGMLVFDGRSLQSALEEFSRYTPDRLVITDPRLRDLRIGGYFPTGDTDALLEALRTGFGLEVTRGTDGIILIAPGRTPAARSGSG